MKKILLVCDLGMSTSLVVKKMQEVAKAENIDVSIEAKAMHDLKDAASSFDCILLGPQIAYRLSEVEAIANTNNIKAECINMMDYGMGDGKKILDQALKLIG